MAAGDSGNAVGDNGPVSGTEPESSDSLKSFGEVVKALRRRARLTQEQFAPQVRYSLPTVASIEQGRRFPPVDFVERAEEVLDAFGVLRGAAKHLSRRPGIASWFRQGSLAGGIRGPVASDARSSMSTTELAWFKSSYSGSSGDSCIEVATTPGTVHVRDTKVEQSPELALSPASWTSFVSYATEA